MFPWKLGWPLDYYYDKTSIVKKNQLLLKWILFIYLFAYLQEKTNKQTKTQPTWLLLDGSHIYYAYTVPIWAGFHVERLTF